MSSKPGTKLAKLFIDKNTNVPFKRKDKDRAKFK